MTIKTLAGELKTARGNAAKFKSERDSLRHKVHLQNAAESGYGMNSIKRVYNALRGR